MDLAMKLVSLRKKNGMTQMELAERLNISRQAISRWEAGAAFPSLDNLRLLSELYGVKINDLLNDASDYADVTVEAETVSRMSDKSDEHIRFKKNQNECYMLDCFYFGISHGSFCRAVVCQGKETRHPNREYRNGYHKGFHNKYIPAGVISLGGGWFRCG